MPTSPTCSSIWAIWPKRPRCTSARTMEAKRGDGMIFINCMEKLTMNAPEGNAARALDARPGRRHRRHHPGAGLHLGSFALIEDHPRFRDAKLGIIVSSLRALQLFLRKNARAQPSARLRRRRRPAGRRPPGFRHGLGASTIWPPSSPRSCNTCKTSSSTFR